MRQPLPPLCEPLQDLDAWTSYLSETEIPVLAGTAIALASLAEDEDAIDAQLIAQTVCGDPLMTLKILAFESANRASKVVTPCETVTAAVLMIGISPFFRAFSKQQTVQDHLASRPAAMAGLRNTITRAHRSAQFALAFATHRQDLDAEKIHEAAMLRDFAEMLLWCHAPDLMLQIVEAQQADQTLRSNDIQRQVLNIEIPELEQSLMKAWQLPELLVRITDREMEDQAQVRNVMLAVRLARHSAMGWTNAALPDDITNIAELLNLSADAAYKLIQQIEPIDENSYEAKHWPSLG